MSGRLIVAFIMVTLLAALASRLTIAAELQQLAEGLGPAGPLRRAVQLRGSLVKRRSVIVARPTATWNCPDRPGMPPSAATWRFTRRCGSWPPATPTRTPSAGSAGTGSPGRSGAGPTAPGARITPPGSWPPRPRPSNCGTPSSATPTWPTTSPPGAAWPWRSAPRSATWTPRSARCSASSTRHHDVGSRCRRRQRSPDPGPPRRPRPVPVPGRRPLVQRPGPRLRDQRPPRAADQGRGRLPARGPVPRRRPRPPCRPAPGRPLLPAHGPRGKAPQLRALPHRPHAAEQDHRLLAGRGSPTRSATPAAPRCPPPRAAPSSPSATASPTSCAPPPHQPHQDGDEPATPGVASRSDASPPPAPRYDDQPNHLTPIKDSTA